ncbi:MAG: hypothetical protein R2744_02790 [Bacteroidales bacterium]
MTGTRNFPSGGAPAGRQNDITRESAYYSFELGAPNAPKETYGGAFSLSTPEKAKNGTTVVYKGDIRDIPDLLVST